MAESPRRERPGRAATIHDVAARAGVATATVSNVLTGRRQVPRIGAVRCWRR